MADTQARATTQTIHKHYQRQATPEVWSEVDELRARVAVLEKAAKDAVEAHRPWTDMEFRPVGPCPSDHDRLDAAISNLSAAVKDGPA